MPTYEYACKDCGHQLEVVQSFSDDALTVCPQCQGNLRKIFGNVGIAFKGSGFYKNDSRNAGSTKTKSATDTAATTTSSDTSSPAGADSKSTAASTPAPSTPAPAKSSD